MAVEVSSYRRLKDELLAVVPDRTLSTVLDLGIGSGLTALRLANAFPAAPIVGIDENRSMLAAAQPRLTPNARCCTRPDFKIHCRADLSVVMSTLAVHHLDGPGKTDLCRRIAIDRTQQRRTACGSAHLSSEEV
jgi:tRNA (cmo5U34)-methyltransferase